MWLFLGMPLIFIFLIYVGISLRFLSTYCYGTQINGIDYTGKTISYVKEDLLKGYANYQLRIIDREGSEYTIHSRDINLKWNVEEKLNRIKKNQKSFLWILDGIRNKTSYQVEVDVSFDKALLNKKIEEFGLLDKKEPIEPVKAYISFEEGEYRIVPEVPGNQVDENKMYEGIKNALKLRETIIDLVDYGCYAMPEVTTESESLLNVMRAIQFFETANITYDFEIAKEEITKAQIHSFIEINDDVASISEDKVRDYILGLKDKYDTVGITRDFTTWDGRKIQVSRGNYGWSIATELETKWLTEAISNGVWAVREPEYVTKGFQRGISDIGNTYIEIDMTKQHMWFYKEGQLLVDTDVVTGNVSKGHGTPSMVACIQYKQTDATLNGEDYSTPVKYWMPIYKNIGIHDASWRSTFGGQIYKRNGSHGCINTPYKKVKTIYENVEVGTPVVLYY